MIIHKPILAAEVCSSIVPSRTLKDAMTEVHAWSDLQLTRRRDLTSALSSAARMTGRPPELIPFTTAALRQHVLQQPAAAHGISKARLHNIRSGLRSVAVRLGVIDDRMTEMSAAWADNLARIGTRQRFGLNTLARFCSQRGVEPCAMDAATLASFLVYLESRTLHASPRKLAGDARRVWNQAARAIDGWSGPPLPKSSRTNSYVLPQEAFTQQFRDDLVVFGRSHAGDPFADTWSLPDTNPSDEPRFEKARSRLPRQSTVDQMLSYCRWAASALVKSGVPIHEITSLRDLVAPLDRTKSILRFLHKEVPGGRSAAGMHVANALRIIAKYHVGIPEADVLKISCWGSKVRVSYTELTPKNHKTMLAAMQPAVISRIYELPRVLMQQARALLPNRPKTAASLALRAVLVELLLKHPLRQQNVLGLRLDQHLLKSDPRRALVTAIEIPSDQTKNSRPIRMPVTPATSATLTCWINVFRPIVRGGPDNPYLFPGQGSEGKHLTPQAMRDAVKSVTGHLAGVTMSPHQFRHFAAHTYLKAHPGEFEAVRQLLGNKSLSVIMRHYSGTQTDVACERLDDVITGHRRFFRQPRKPITPTRRAVL